MKVYSNFKDYLGLLRETYISIYGEEYRNQITERIENAYFIFSSSPLVLEQYLNKFPNKVTFEEKKDIEQKLMEYNKAKNLWYPWYELKFKNFLNEIIDGSNQIPLEVFTNNNFSGGLIDVFSSETERILRSEFAIPELKESILKDREKLTYILKSNGVDISFLRNEIIDSIINYRNQVHRKYKSMIVQHTTEGKILIDDFKKKYNYDLNDWDISEVCYRNVGLSYSIDEIGINIIKIPYSLLQLMESKNIDETLIHELTHTIDRSGHRIVNEIRIEKQAMKIAKQFAENGIFLFDDPNNYQEFNSFYTLLFPVTFDFFERYSDILNDCTIKKQDNLLSLYFGPNWDVFCEKLEELNDCLMACNKRNLLDKVDIHKYEIDFRSIIESMNQHFIQYSINNKINETKHKL